MKKTIQLSTLLFGVFCFGQQIVVDQNYTVEELVRDVLVNSSCAETFNYSSFTGTAESINGIGYFNRNGSFFSFSEGIIISTGNASSAAAPNIDIWSLGTELWPGDQDLEDITQTNDLLNASYISFDFIPQTNRISFRFLFASEEYADEFQCIYSDVFAFILTDSSGNSTNLALVPRTDDRISTTTIRPGVAGLCDAQNTEFYGGRNYENSPISMTGQTKSLVAASEVTPGATYNIKLVIADNLDPALDSAVFLEGGSFSIEVSLGPNRTILSGSPLCIGEIFTMDATTPGAIAYRWYRDNLRMTQFDDMSVVSVTQDGTYTVDVEFSATCISKGFVEIEYIQPPHLANAPIDLNTCDFDNNGEQAIDLTQNTSPILGNQDPVIYEVYYFLSQQDAENFENPLDNPEQFRATQSQQTIYARISSGSSCYEIAPFQINLLQFSFAPTLQDDYLLCRDGNGLPIGDVPVLDTGLSPLEFSFTWYEGTLNSGSQIPNENNPSYTATNPGVYSVEIVSLIHGCAMVLSTSVFSIDPPTLFEVDVLSDFFADNQSATIRVEGTSTYLYALDDGAFTENPDFHNLGPGEHTAHVQDVYSCYISSQVFVIVDYPRFFTPNGDGINDIWKISGLVEMENPEITIFDRFGIIQHQFQDEIGWDGTLNGNRAPSSDYWFRILYDNAEGIRKEYRNHFTLKR